MKRRMVTLGRYALIKSARQAMAWAAEFSDSSLHNCDIKGGIIAHQVARNLFTSRPPNLLSVHGRDRFRLPADRAYNGQPVINYLRDRWSRRTASGQRAAGLKLVISINLSMLGCAVPVDVDQLLTRTAEATFADVGRRWFREDDITFVLGIHHGMVRFTDPWIVKRQRASGKPVKTTPRTRSHVHVLLLPNSEIPEYRSIIKSLIAGFEGHLANALKDLSVLGRVLSRRTLPAQEEALLREASLATCEATYRGEDSPWGHRAVAESARVIAEFEAQSRSARVPKSAARRHENRKAQILKYAVLLGRQIRSKAAERRLEFSQNLNLWMKELLGPLRQVAIGYGPVSAQASIHFYSFPCKRVLLAQGINRAGLQANQVENISHALDEFHQLRKAVQIHCTAYNTLLEMMLLPRMEPPKELPWINKLADLAHGPKTEKQARTA